MEKWTWANAQAELSDKLLEILFSIHNHKTRYYLIAKLIKVSKQYKRDHSDSRINDVQRRKLIKMGIIRTPKHRKRRVYD